MRISTSDCLCLVRQNVYPASAGKKQRRQIDLSGPCDFVIESCYYYLIKKKMDAAYEAAKAVRDEAIAKGENPSPINTAPYDPFVVFSDIWENPEALRRLGDLKGANPYEYMVRFDCGGNRAEKGWVTDLSPKTHRSGRGDRMMTVEFVDDNGAVIGTALIDYSTSLQRGFCNEFRE